MPRGARLTVIDATDVKPDDRKRLLNLAREYHVLPVAIVFDLPPNLCDEGNRTRGDVIILDPMQGCT